LDFYWFKYRYLSKDIILFKDFLMNQEKLKKYLHYDPLTGIFTRLIATSNRVKVGDLVTTKNALGYGVIKIEGTVYQLSQLAMLYMYGAIPNFKLAFADKDISNLRIRNIVRADMLDPPELRVKEPDNEIPEGYDPWQALLDKNASKRQMKTYLDNRFGQSLIDRNASERDREKSGEKSGEKSEERSEPNPSERESSSTSSEDSADVPDNDEYPADEEWDTQDFSPPLNPVVTPDGVQHHTPVDPLARFSAFVDVGGKLLNLGKFRTRAEADEVEDTYLRSIGQ